MNVAGTTMSSLLNSRHQYVPIEKEDSLCSETSEVRSSWTERQMSLRSVTLLMLGQSLLWLICLTMVYLLCWPDVAGITIPIDRNLRDAEGNSYPAASAISFETVTFAQNKSYMAPLDGNVPSADTDARWKALQPSDGLIQASVDAGFDIDHLPSTNISSVVPGLHMYGLEVFHQLHCLDRIRKSFHAEHYFPNASQKQLIWHREHCIDHLRQGIMCSGDVSMDRWEYDAEFDYNWLKTDVPHMCRNFQRLSGWVRKWRLRPKDWPTHHKPLPT